MSDIAPPATLEIQSTPGGTWLTFNQWMDLGVEHKLVYAVKFDDGRTWCADYGWSGFVSKERVMEHQSGFSGAVGTVSRSERSVRYLGVTD